MLLRVIATGVAFVLVGCGGIAHLDTRPILFEADAAAIARSAELVIFQAYNGRHFRGKESLSILLGLEEDHQRKVVKPSADGVFRVNFTPFMRADIFWVIPPFFALFIDNGSYLLIRLDGGAVYGIAIEEGSLKKAYHLGPRNRLVEIRQSELPFVVNVQAATQEERTLEIRLMARSQAATPTSRRKDSYGR
jgi:hypothetical protein